MGVMGWRKAVIRGALAAGALSMLSMPGSPALAASSPIAAARHHGVIAGDTVRWTSSYLLREDGQERIQLAFPLPAGAKIEVSPDVAPIEREGRLVALQVLAPYSAGRIIVVTVAERLSRSGREAKLAPPLAAGDAVQIVDVDGVDDARFEPDARTHLARHVGFFAPIDLPPSARDACDRGIGYHRVRAVDDPMYLVASPTIAADEGIRGTLVSASERLRTGALGMGGAFVAIMAALAALQRRLARAAKVEQAERALAAEFAELEGASKEARKGALP